MSSRSLKCLLFAILLLGTSAVYFTATRFQFVNWDDRDMLIENPLLHPPTAANFRQFWTSGYMSLYTPLPYSLWWTLTRLMHDSLNPASFHLLNIFFHVVSTLLVFSILLRCVKNPLAAFTGAVLFALHPMQVETVAWIAELNNALAAALSLAAIRLYLAYADRAAIIPPLPILRERAGVRVPDEPTPTPALPLNTWGRGTGAFYYAAFMVFLLALFSKPIAVVVPLIAAILDRGLTRRPWARIILALSPWILFSILFAIIAHNIQSVTDGSIWSRPLIALDALGFYLRQFLWPTHLNVDYARTPHDVWISRQWITNAIVPLIVALMLWSARKSARLLAVAALISLAALLPVLGLVPFYFQRYSTVADRYVYLAMLGPALALAWALSAWRPAMILAATLILAGALAGLTTPQLESWRDSNSLADHILHLDPNSTIGNEIKAAELARTGHNLDAIPYYRASLRCSPDDDSLHLNLANAYYRSGQYPQAIDEYHAAINLAGQYRIRALLYLGWAYIKSGQPQPAQQAFLQVLQLDPANQQARDSLNQLSSLRVPTP